MCWKNYWMGIKNNATKSFKKNQNVVNLEKAPDHEKSSQKKPGTQSP